MKDLYEILGVEPSASQEQIQKMYRKLAKKYHADANANDPDLNMWSHKRMVELNQAYEILGDPQKRAQYDWSRRRSSPPVEEPTQTSAAKPTEQPRESESNSREPWVHPVTYRVLTGKTRGEELIQQYKAGERDFRGYDLLGADLSGADLSGIDLQGSYLCFANLSEVNLTGANLEKTYWDCANLRGANLSRANLKRAYLHSAELIEANLCEADLSDADLSHADMSRANLEKTNILFADLRNANLKNVDLRGLCLCFVKLPDKGESQIIQLLHALELGKFYAPQHASSRALNLRARIMAVTLFLLMGSLVGGYAAHKAPITDAASLIDVAIPSFLAEAVVSIILGMLAGAVVGFIAGLGLNLLIWPEIAILKRIGMATGSAFVALAIGAGWGVIVSLIVWTVYKVGGIEDPSVGIAIGSILGLITWARLTAIGWMGYPSFPHPIR